MSEGNKAVVARVMEIVNEGRFELFDELFSEDFVEHNPMAGVPGDRDGRKMSVGALRQAFPDLEMEVHRQIAEDDLVVEHWTTRGTHKGEFMGVPATDKSIEVQGIDISRVRDGQIVEHWTQMDTMTMLQQLGLAGG